MASDKPSAPRRGFRQVFDAANTASRPRQALPRRDDRPPDSGRVRTTAGATEPTNSLVARRQLLPVERAHPASIPRVGTAADAPLVARPQRAVDQTQTRGSAVAPVPPVGETAPAPTPRNAAADGSTLPLFKDAGSGDTPSANTNNTLIHGDFNVHYGVPSSTRVGEIAGPAVEEDEPGCGSEAVTTRFHLTLWWTTVWVWRVIGKLLVRLSVVGLLLSIAHAGIAQIPMFGSVYSRSLSYTSAWAWNAFLDSSGIAAGHGHRDEAGAGEIVFQGPPALQTAVSTDVMAAVPHALGQYLDQLEGTSSVVGLIDDAVAQASKAALAKAQHVQGDVAACHDAMEKRLRKLWMGLKSFESGVEIARARHTASHTWLDRLERVGEAVWGGRRRRDAMRASVTELEDLVAEYLIGLNADLTGSQAVRQRGSRSVGQVFKDSCFVADAVGAELNRVRRHDYPVSGADGGDAGSSGGSMPSKREMALAAAAGLGIVCDAMRSAFVQHGDMTKKLAEGVQYLRSFLEGELRSVDNRLRHDYGADKNRDLTDQEMDQAATMLIAATKTLGRWLGAKYWPDE